MIALHLAQQGETRVWLEGLPDYFYTSREVMERKIPVSGPVQLTARRAAIEVFVHKGGHCPYGLLGAEFVPDLTGLLTIQVMISAANLQTLEDMIPSPPTDRVRRGLPLEYADSVMQGAIRGNSVAPLGAGVLQFNCAAHGEVGSSTDAFRQLGEMVTRLVGMEPSSITVERLLDLIDHKL